MQIFTDFQTEHFDLWMDKKRILINEWDVLDRKKIDGCPDMDVCAIGLI